MKKRIINAIVALLLVLMPVAANAAIGTMAGSSSICPGTEADIPISVTNCNGVSAISLALSYDASKVTYLGYQNPSLHFGTNLHVNATGGMVYLTWYSLNAVDFGSEILIELRFEGISGTSALTWNTANCEYSDVNGNAITSTYTNGSITVYALPTVTSQPNNVTITEGQNATFSINASGQGINYQWQVKPAELNDWINLSNTLPYSNVTTRTMKITNVSMNLNGNQYRCMVSGTCDPEAYSDAATLNVNEFLPTITTTAVSATSCHETEFEIPISVTNCNNVGAISLALSYNTDLVTYLGYDEANSSLENGLMEINEDNGMVYFSWIATQSALNIGDAILVNLLFESQSGNSTFSWNAANCEYSTVLGHVFPTAFNSGTSTVYFTPSITSNPLNMTVVEGSDATFSVQASGQGLSYRWQVSTDAGQNWSNISNGTHYSNATTATLTVVNATLGMDNYRYRCEVSGTCEPAAYSNHAVMHVTPLLPTIITSLVNTTACQDVEFDADIAVTSFINVGSVSLALSYDTTKLSYQGYENLNSALEDGSLFVNEKDGVVYISWMSVAGATIDGGIMMSLKFSGIPGNSTMTWKTEKCEYANVQGLIFPTSYQNGTITIYAAPYITTQPSNKTVIEGSSTTISIGAGGRNVSYQWQGRSDEGSIWANLINGGHYNNVTGSTLSILNATLSMDGSQYRCVVSGECEPEVISEHAKLTVNELLPTITTRVGDLSTCSGTEFGVPVSVTNFINVGAVSLALSYNPNILTYTGYEWVNSHLSNGELYVNAYNGVVYITWMSVSGATIGNGTLLWLDFVGVAGNSTLTWMTDSCEYSNTVGSVFPTQFINGSVIVQQENFEITSHPVNQDVVMGEGTSFSIETSGNGLTFQWNVSEDSGSSWTALEAGTLYSDVNTETLLVNNTTFDMNGYLYRCEVNGLCGVKYSNSALLTVGLAEDFHQVTVAVMPEEGGEVTGEGVYYEGNAVTLTATKNVGYHFVNWVENDIEVSTDSVYVFSIHEDHDFTAHFELNTYTVSVSGNIGNAGELSGAGIYNYGETCTVSAVANEGFTFVRWTRDGVVVSTEPLFSFIVTENRSYEAQFVQNSYEILAIALPEECGIVGGSGTYMSGATCTLTATANAGYVFVNWTKGGVEVSNSSTYSFTVTESANYVAHFIEAAFRFITPGNWSTPSNWSNGALPDSTDVVFIDAPCQLDQNATVAVLTVSNGQSLTLQSGKTLTVTGNLTNTVATGLVIEDGAQLVHNVANVQATVKKAISQFSGTYDGWHLIALPLTGSSNVASVTNLLEDEYDLYGYEEATTYWRNQKHTESGFTVLEATKGYLYANEAEVTLEFSGTLENSSNTVSVPLSYTNEAHLSGFNLVGNSFPCNAYLNKDYYVLSADSSGIASEPILATTPIPPCTAVFVKALTEGETVVFTRVAP